MLWRAPKDQRGIAAIGRQGAGLVLRQPWTRNGSLPLGGSPWHTVLGTIMGSSRAATATQWQPGPAFASVSFLYENTDGLQKGLVQSPPQLLSFSVVSGPCRSILLREMRQALHGVGPDDQSDSDVERCYC